MALCSGMVAPSIPEGWLSVAGQMAQQSPEYSNENILFDLDVTKFKYEWENHCTGLLAGYDINVAIGEYDNSTGHIRLYKTILKTEWPTMFKYPNNRVSVISNYRNTNSKKMVLLVTTHNGEKLIQYLE